MESLLDFIYANYIWLIIILAVILLAIVGFIADKRGFSDKLKSKKTKEDGLEKVNNEVLVVPAVEETPIENNEMEESVVEDKMVFEPSIEKEEVSMETETMEETPIENNEMEESVVEDEIVFEPSIENEVEEIPVENIEEDLYAPMGNVSFEQEDLNIDEDFAELLNDVEETSSEVDIEIPKDESPIELDEDEDIWKF